jgi:hypothetical protein
MANRTFRLVFALLNVIGAWLAYRLGAIHGLQTFKLLNALGIVYGLLGVVVLSEFVTQSEKWRLFIVNTVSGLTIWAQGAIPLGGALISIPLFVFFSDDFPSSLKVFKAFGAYFGFALLPTFLLEDFVFVPKFSRFKDPLVRTRIFGLSLVILGMVAQLVAAIQDLLSS